MRIAPAARSHQSMRFVDVIAIAIFAAFTCVGVLSHNIEHRTATAIQVSEVIVP